MMIFHVGKRSMKEGSVTFKILLSVPGLESWIEGRN